MDAQRSPVPQRNRSGQHGTSSFGKSFLLPGCPPSFPAVINIRTSTSNLHGDGDTPRPSDEWVCSPPY